MAIGDSETRDLSGFTRISVASGIKATLVSGSTNKVDITVEGIALDKIITDVSGDKLKVTVDQKWWKMIGRSSKRKVSVVITYTEELEYISSSSGSSVKSENVINSDDLGLKSSNGSNLRLEIKAGDVTVDVSSGASMSLKGQADDLVVDLSSGSTYNGMELRSNDVNVEASSGASAKVWVTGVFVAEVSSGASIRYKGDPSSKNIDKSSGGSVSKY